MARNKVIRSRRAQRELIRQQRKLRRKRIPKSAFEKPTKVLRDSRGRFRKGTGAPLPSGVAPFEQRIERLEREYREQEKGRPLPPRTQDESEDYKRLRQWIEGFSTAEEAIENFHAYEPTEALIDLVYSILPSDAEMSQDRRRLTA